MKKESARAASIARLAADIRFRLQLHQEQGFDYPLTPELRAVLQQPVESTKETRHQKPLSLSACQTTVIPWNVLQEDIGSCKRCSLSSTARGKVFGRGAQQAELLVVGDYSAQQEHCSQEFLFGQKEDILLWKMLKAIGQEPERVYVTNALKCCPGELAAQEVDSTQCVAFLRNEIALIRPRVICAMGEIPAAALLGQGGGVSRVRGRFFSCAHAGVGEEVRVIVSYHPRFLLQHESMKKAAWQDLQKIRDFLAEK